MKPLVLYHGGGCTDGFCAAWAAHRILPDADFLAVNYGEPPPDVSGREVYILDFSYKRPIMEEMLQKASKLICLDHHKTAQAELAGLVVEDGKGVICFNLGKSGGRLAWEYFFSEQLAPGIVAYTEDRDLWRWCLPGSKAVNAALRSYPFDFKVWDEWGVLPVPALMERLVGEGEAILRYQNQQVDFHCAQALEIDLAGHRVLAVNATTLQSEIGERLAQGRPFGATFFLKNGKKIWSLRGMEGGIDVAELARKMGGGGHAQAAGFTETLGP